MIPEKLEKMKNEVKILAMTMKDPRCSKKARIAGPLLVAYVLNPVDLVPDFIPGLGFADDLIILMITLPLIKGMIPDDLWEEYAA
jgi:uncharacterized membrane protein YkvA (DUF1232 family)